MKKMRVFVYFLLLSRVAYSSDWIERMFNRQAQQKHADTLAGRADQYTANVSDNESDDSPLKQEKAKAKRMFAKMKQLSGWDALSASCRTSAGHLAVQTDWGKQKVRTEFKAELDKFQE